MSRWTALVLAFLVSLLPARVWAIEPADTFSIISARAYGSLLATDDVLLVIHYDIAYEDCPDSRGEHECPEETATEAYLGAYYDDSAGVTRVSAAPVYFVVSGYGQGVMSVYLNPTDVDDWDITWGDEDAARISGNPTLFTLPPKLDTDIVWRDSDDAGTTLATDVRAIATTLENRPEWAGVSLRFGDRLEPDGEDYFESAIPNLRLMAPDLFAGSIINPDFIERDHGDSYANDLMDLWDDSGIENQFEDLADSLQQPVSMVSTAFVLVIGLIAAVWAAKLTGNGLVTIPVLAIVIAAGTLIGFVPMVLTGSIGFMAALTVGFVLFLKRVGG